VAADIDDVANANARLRHGGRIKKSERLAIMFG
jgi:hypothetical protein